MAELLSPSNTNNANADDNEEDHKPIFQHLVLGPDSGPGSASLGRRPRGRPPGSKNKPKPPVIITQPINGPTMAPIFLQISPNTDILSAAFDFAASRRLGLSVLSAAGAVSNPSLRHPPITLNGKFEILSLAGTFFPISASASAAAFRVSVAGAQGQVVGGTVAGPLLAAGTVVVTAAGFSHPEFHHLPPPPPPPSCGRGGEEEKGLKEEVKVEGGCSYGGGPSSSGSEMVLWGSPAAAVPRAPPPHLHRAPATTRY